MESNIFFSLNLLQVFFKNTGIDPHGQDGNTYDE